MLEHLMINFQANIKKRFKKRTLKKNFVFLLEKHYKYFQEMKVMKYMALLMNICVHDDVIQLHFFLYDIVDKFLIVIHSIRL